MAGTARGTAHAVALVDALARAAYEFDYFAALRWIECAHPDLPRLGTGLRAPDDPVRLAQEVDMGFAASALHSYGARGGSAPRLRVNFFGLLGPNGPLPLHLTEFTRARIREAKDRTFAAFLDVFHHRLLCLFYRAGAASLPVIEFDRPSEDRFAMYVGALFGGGTPATSHREVLDELAKLHYAGRFAGQRSAEGLRDVLADFFGVDARIVEFVGRWLAIPRRDQTRLGDLKTARLGATAVLGTTSWVCQGAFRIVLGPLAFADYERLLPDRASLPRLAALVRDYTGDELDWEVQLLLQRDEVPDWRLGDRQLGWTTFLAGRPERDPDTLVLPGDRALAPVR